MKELMKKNDVWGIYWVKEIISIAKQKKLKYPEIWAANYYRWLDNQSSWISTELITEKIDGYYLSKVMKK